MSTAQVHKSLTLHAVKVPIRWNSTLPVFASEEFLRAVSDEYGWLMGVDTKGESRCLLPYTVSKKAGMRFVRFRVETIPLCDEFPVQAEKEFLNSVVEYFREHSGSMIVPAANTALFRTYPDGAAAAPYGTLINDLTQPEPTLWKAISEAYRKDIRRALNAGVQIEEGPQHLEAAYQVFADTMKRSNEPAKAFADIETLVFSLPKNIKIYVACHENTVHASLILAFSDYAAYTLYGGTIEQPAKGAMHLLHWEAMRRLREEGVKRFNFSGVRICPEKGSKQEGIFTFKSRFGGELMQGYMWKYSLQRVPAFAYSAGMRLLRGGDIVDLEHHKLTIAR